VAAYDGGLTPLLCLTKADLASPDELLSLYRPLGVEALFTSRGSGVEELAARLAGHTSVLFGQSGVGKSTLVNQLVPDAYRAVGDVSGIGKGRHISSSAVALELPAGGTVIDTPGVRSFGLGAVTPERVLAAFPDLVDAAARCPPGCSHLPGTPGCALDGAAVSAARLESLRRLLVALTE
jgi:ribosome biogenesis GTPase